MTTELEMPASTTGNQRRLDMNSFGHELGIAAHGYMNSSCQVHFASDPLHYANVGIEVSMPMMENELYKSMFECHHLGNSMQLQNVHTMRQEPGGSCTLDYSKDHHINVDSVPSYFTIPSDYINPSTICNSPMFSNLEHENTMKLQHDIIPEGFRADVIDQPLQSWAALPYQASKAHQPPLFVNSYLMDDVMMNENSSISSLLSSIQPINNTDQHFSSDLNLIPYNIQNNASSSSNSMSASEFSPQVDSIGQILGAVMPGLTTTRAPPLQVLFEDDSFEDGQFVSAFFSDNEVGEGKLELSEETAFMGGSINHNEDDMPAENSPFMQISQLVSGSALTNAGTFESGDVGSSDHCGMNTMKKVASISDAGNINVDGQIHETPAACQPSTNKRAALMAAEGDQLGPQRKRVMVCGMILPSEVDAGLQAAGDAADHALAGSEDHNSNNKLNNGETAAVDNTNTAASREQQMISPSPKQDKQTASTPPGKTTPTKSTARASKQSTACDPQSVAARHRRERISERLKILQELVPNGSKVDIVTMLEKAINYVKFLQLQVKVLTTDEYWPNSQKLNQPHEMNLLNLLMSKATEESTSKNKIEIPKKKASKS